jgi:hypothetical protein
VSAQVISISSAPRTGRHDWEEQALLKGFEKALGLSKGLEPASPLEKQMAVENWFNAGMLSEEERNVVCQFYGWERAP